MGYHLVVNFQAAVVLAAEEGAGKGVGQVLHPLDSLQLVFQQRLGGKAICADLVWAILLCTASPDPTGPPN